MVPLIGIGRLRALGLLRVGFLCVSVFLFVWVSCRLRLMDFGPTLVQHCVT